MTIKNHATLAFIASVCLASGLVAYAYGGIHGLLGAEALLTLFGVNLPFFILWAAAMGSKGVKVSQWAIAISIAFILLDVAVYFGTGSSKSDASSIVFGIIASMEMIGSLLVVVAAIVSCVRGESDKPDNAG